MNGLKEVMMLLIANDGGLSKKWLDHPLVGNWKGYRECHIGGDLSCSGAFLHKVSVTFLCLCKRKVTKRKHTLPSRPLHAVQRVRFANGTFRRNIHVAAKSDGHRARRPLGIFR